MIILVSSKISQKNIHDSLGKPEYSYYFLMKDFLPALERVGRVFHVQSEEEVEALHDCFTNLGEEIVFLSVSPPHQTPLGLKCPTICLFAWEFDSLPNVAWDGNPKNDWRYVFSRIAGVISTSRETAQLVSQAAPAQLPVTAMPAPIWNRYAALGKAVGHEPALAERHITFHGIVIDSAVLGLSADGLVSNALETHGETTPKEPLLSRTEQHKLEAPQTLRALARFTRQIFRDWRNELATIDDTIAKVTTSPVSETLAPAKPKHQPEQEQVISVAGVVYSAVLNPADGRKNWVELITAFCWAFKETDNATLVLKMTHHDLEYYRVVLVTLLSRLSPFRCRVVVLHGFLDDAQYQGLIAASTYYVNASTGEGLCLPLMEFLAGGKPAIAPKHTAMADYINDDLGFVLKTSLEPACWPHDPTGMLHTHKHRLNWQSLMEAFRYSHAVATSTTPHYRNLSGQAYQKMRQFASIEAIAPQLTSLFEKALSHAKNPGRKKKK
ncbi:glycosyltransferase involved in cell wall biosynthesis [Pseudomonas fluvialis]|uniref:Glycosyltransferase involved in cell wall biosynthesis n=1 Tax=Pseudomonas fluvialis TaxID=1793966 RepID=A0A7X0BQ67_9PSED|nr:glycosyltransferase [Pseudomonas fluvialis]MBB6340543.1 glycosyltransferase involved in cell wall biosynthesis [Pseudomonas fluvialis]